ncbi:MAG: cation diffusion facilitator family transporter [Anaerolineales bacterium]
MSVWSGTPSARAREVRRVLWIVLALNLLVTVVKLVIGLATGALAVIAEAFHSIMDASSNIIGLVGMRVAEQPPDRAHPYGHRKYETVAALAIGALLMLASWEILQALVQRIIAGGAPDVETQDIWLLALTFPVNVAVVVYERSKARRLASDLLEADVAHTRTDLLVTVAVIGSLLAVRVGFVWLDIVVALAIVVLIGATAVGILRRTSDVLADTAVLDPQDVAAIVEALPDVWYVHRVRSRGRPDAVNVDLHVKVDPAMSTQQSHAVASEVERELKDRLPGVVDAVVHVEPGLGKPPSEWEALAVRVRAEADALAVGIHDLHIHAEPGNRYAIEMHVEVDAMLTLGAAHALVDQLEARVSAAVPAVASITSHIEPLQPNVPGELGLPFDADELRRTIIAVADAITGPGVAHDVQVHHVDGLLTATVHLTLPAEEPLTTAHARAEEVELRLLSELPQLRRVVVHAEPPDQ